TAERKARHPAGRAHCRTREGGERGKLEDVSGPMKRLATPGEADHEIAADGALERVAGGDAQRGRDRPRRGDVDEKGRDEDRWPYRVTQPQEGEEGDSRGSPYRCSARVHDGQQEAELSGHEVERRHECKGQ